MHDCSETARACYSIWMFIGDKGIQVAEAYHFPTKQGAVQKAKSKFTNLI